MKGADRFHASNILGNFDTRDLLLKRSTARMKGGIKINEAFQRQQEKQGLNLQLNKRAPSSKRWHSMLQVPSTSQNQLRDQYNDMIQFHDGKWNADWSRCAQMFTMIQLQMVYTQRAHFTGMIYTQPQTKPVLKVMSVLHAGTLDSTCTFIANVVLHIRQSKTARRAGTKTIM